MATEAILADVGMLYKRLFNHRPIIQNEVHYFVREFETKRGEDSDLKTLQDTMSKSDEINTVFLNEIACSMPHFKKIKEKSSVIRDTCEELLSGEDLDLWISPEEQARLDQQVDEYRVELKKKEQDIFAMNEREIKKLKEEIDELRESRSKLRSHVSSSVTIYPAVDAPSPELEELPQGAEVGVKASLDKAEEGEGRAEVVSLDKAEEEEKEEGRVEVGLKASSDKAEEEEEGGAEVGVKAEGRAEVGVKASSDKGEAEEGGQKTTAVETVGDGER